MEFTGTSRFKLIRKLGQGGMGIVYEAHDRERNMRVALKTLRTINASRLYQFKREFRALADLSHPNIVELYELFAEDEQWFLTMELVAGSDFITYVRGPGWGQLDDGEDCATLTSGPGMGDAETREALSRSSSPGISDGVASGGDGSTDGNTDSHSGPHRSATIDSLAPPPLPPYRVAAGDIVDLDRLQATLGQLASALHALHSVGMVHRDLKPSNIRVTPEGRVVLVDFGVVANLGETREPGSERTPVGTPVFMAPEQMRGVPVTAAVDWYAVGTLMYQALTGNLPYWWGRKNLQEIKDAVDPLPASALAEGIPDDLEELCSRLLEREPARRPDGERVLAILGISAMSGSYIRGVDDRARDSFVGRAAELEQLAEGFRAARRGRGGAVRATGASSAPGDVAGQSVLIAGRSGMGKTFLVDHFTTAVLPDLVDTGAAPLVLAGRCYQQETLPYKAFDGVLDALTRYLLGLSPAARETLLPDDCGLVAQLFPVLRRVPECRSSVSVAGRNPAQVRAQVIAALRVIFERLAAERALVIRVEDLQWADRESIELLRGLLQPHAPAGVLILVTLRIESSSRASLPGTESDELEFSHRVTLGPLAPGEQRELIARVASDVGLADHLGDSLWRESGGHPMLLVELALHATRTEKAPAGIFELALKEAIGRRVSELVEPARELLEALAVAGEPTPLDVLVRAVGLSDRARERACAVLRIERLIRVMGVQSVAPGDEASSAPDAVPGAATPGRSSRWLDTYHDKVRETVSERLSPTRGARLHGALARALRSWGLAPAARLARHWRAAGDREQAVLQLDIAARSAAEKLALEQAAGSYREVLELLPDDDAAVSSSVARVRCRAMLGVAEHMRVIEQTDQAAALLDRALPIAEDRELLEEQARAHYLRGNLLFPRGDLDGCQAEHQRAQEMARRAGSPELEARAQSGLGDAQYMRGHMVSSFGHFDRCIAICREHDLIGVEASNLAMRGMTRYYRRDLEAALRDSVDAAELAARIGNARGEIVARNGCIGWILYEMGRLDEAREEFGIALERARELGARRFEPNSLTFLAKIALRQARADDRARAAQGDGAAEAEKLAKQSVAICRDTGFKFVGPMALAALALCTDDPATRASALAEAEEVLASGTASHNYLYVYRDGIDVALAIGDLDRALGYAEALEDYTRAEPLAWSDFFVARARVLVAHASGDRSDEVRTELRAVLDLARQSRLITASWALERALDPALDPE